MTNNINKYMEDYKNDISNNTLNTTFYEIYLLL